jgi:peptidoglycan LD-endopeptidase LytH
VRRWHLLVLFGAALFLLPAARRAGRDATAYLTAPSPHARYAATLRLRSWFDPLAGSSAWLEAGGRALLQPQPVTPPFTTTGLFQSPADAVAWRIPVRRGHRVTIEDEFTGGALFVDLFDASTGTRVASADGEGRQLAYDADADGELIVRAQPPLGSEGRYSVAQRSDPSVLFPVKGLTPRAVQSQFGAARDAGRRAHEGIDIFAPRGTPVVAATDGWIGTSLKNGLGGNVVWIWSPFRRVRTYYAHLDRHAVTPGERVKAGDVVGYVGNTGNARGGPTHLHFGIYAGGSGSVDPLPFVCGANCS